MLSTGGHDRPSGAARRAAARLAPPLYRLTVGLGRLAKESRSARGSHLRRCAVCFDSGFVREEDAFGVGGGDGAAAAAGAHGDSRSDRADGHLELCAYCPARAVLGGRFQVVRLLGTGHFSRVYLVRDLFVEGCVRVVKMLRPACVLLAHEEAAWLAALEREDRDGRIGAQKYFGMVVEGGGRHVGLVLEFLQPAADRLAAASSALRRMVVDVCLLLRVLHGGAGGEGAHDEWNKSQNDRAKAKAKAKTKTKTKTKTKRPEQRASAKGLAAIHADVKPENIMYCGEAERFRLIDFGNCVPLERRTDYHESFEIQTLLYRAPEVLAGIGFDAKIDMWSLGITAAQWAGTQRGPLFVGSDHASLLAQIAEVLGPLPDAFAQGRFFAPGLPLRSAFAEVQDEAGWARWRRGNLSRVLGVRDAALLDLLAGLLECDPARRLSPAEALAHPYLAPLVPFPP